MAVSVPSRNTSSRSSALHPNACSIGLFDGEMVLLIQRAYAPFYGYWTFPGGKMDPGETPRECVAREAFEETGLIVRDPVQVLVESVGEGKLKFNLAVFAAQHPRQAPIVSHEIANWDWVPIDEIQSYRTTEHLAEIASACLECLALSGQET